MNLVDANRYCWHDHFPLADESLLDFCLRLPAVWKLDCRFFKEYFKQVFPDLARVPYKSTGVSLFEEPSSGRKERLARAQRRRHVIERASWGRLRLCNPEQYYHYDQWYRKHRRIRSFLRGLLLEGLAVRRGHLERSQLERLLAREDRGGDLSWLILKIASFELFWQEVAAPDVGTAARPG